MKKHLLKFSAKALLSLALCTFLTASFPGMSMAVAAKGGLNADEQALLNDFAAGITVDGQSLKPPSSYVSLAADLLSAVDLTSSEVNRLYAKMDAAYDALRSEHITSVEQAQNSYAKTVVQAITGEAMQILQNSSNKAGNDDDEDYDKNDDYNKEDEDEDDDPVDFEGVGEDDDPADSRDDNDQKEEETSTEIELESATEASEESTSISETYTEAATEAETTIQEPVSDMNSSNSEIDTDDASGFPLPIAVGIAAGLVAVTGGILFFRQRNKR